MVSQILISVPIELTEGTLDPCKDCESFLAYWLECSSVSFGRLPTNNHKARRLGLKSCVSSSYRLLSRSEEAVKGEANCFGFAEFIGA